MNHLAVGAKGFLGRHLTAALPSCVGVDLPECDVREHGRGQQTVGEAVEWHAKRDGAPTVWHLAALNGSTAGFYSDPWSVLHTQIAGTLNVIDACVANGVETLVLFSSSEVYQTPPRIPTPEDVPFSIPDIKNPRFSYALGKQAAEGLAWWSAIPRVVVIRPHNVYAADQRPGHVIPDMVKAMLEAPLPYPAPHNPEFDSHRQGWPVIPEFTIKDAGATRAFIHARDFTAACLKIAEKTEATEGRVREVYHVGTQDQITMASLAGKIAKLLGKNFKWRSAPGLPGGTPNRCPDVTKLRALGWEPTIGLDEGLAEVVSAAGGST